jgi:hypothetical protein
MYLEPAERKPRKPIPIESIPKAYGSPSSSSYNEDRDFCIFVNYAIGNTAEDRR